MKVEGKVKFDAPVQKVWDVLQDPESLRSAVPGVQSLEQVGDNEYEATLKLGVAAIKGTYSAKVKIYDQVEPKSYRLGISGEGGPGFVNVDGSLELEDHGSTTTVHYDFDAQVGGAVAAVGQRMLGGVAKLMMGQFFGAMQKLAKS